MKERISYRLLMLVTVFVAAISILNIISAKLWRMPFFGWEFTFSAGIIAYWVTFAVTDSISEVFGSKLASFIVWMGFAANLLVLGLTQFALVLPPATEIFTAQGEFQVVLGAAPRIVFASLVAYLIAQLHDVWAFEWWRQRTGGRHLWVRNNLSTIGSQLIDSIIFNLLAFVLLAPEPMSFGLFLNATSGYWLFKVIIAFLDTPLVYFLVRWLREEQATILATAPSTGALSAGNLTTDSLPEFAPEVKSGESKR